MSQVETQLQTPITEKQAALIDGIASGLNIRQAALKAGYSEATCEGTIYRELRSPAWGARLAEAVQHYPDMRIAIAKARIPRLIKAEEKALDLLEADPEMLIKNPKLAEREYKLAGLLADAPQQQTSITVNVQSFMAQLWDQAPNASDAQHKHRDKTVDCKALPCKG